MNGAEDYKVRSLTIFPDAASVTDFNTMGDSDLPTPNSWEFFDDALWTTIPNGYNPATGKYKNRLISSFQYSQTVEPSGYAPTESIYTPGDYDVEPPVDPVLLGHYDWNSSGQLEANLDGTQGTLYNWGGTYYDDVFDWTTTDYDYDTIGSSARLSDAFNGFEDEYYYKLRSYHRNQYGCVKKYLGVDQAACQANSNVASVDALLVPKEEATMFVFRLRTNPNDENNPGCLYWTMQVAEGPC